MLLLLRSAKSELLLLLLEEPRRMAVRSAPQCPRPGERPAGEGEDESAGIIIQFSCFLSSLILL